MAPRVVTDGRSWRHRVARFVTGADTADVAADRDAPEPSAVRAFLVSWDEPARDRLRARCHATGVIDVVGFGRDLRSTLRFLREHPVDVVVAELDAAGAPAGVVGLLRSVLPEARIVAWADDVTHFEDAFDAGVDAWVSRAATPETLAAAVTGRRCPAVVD